MAGMTDWYLASQLQNFRSAFAAHIRRISTASRWASWAELADEQAINDVIAYINTLVGSDE